MNEPFLSQVAVFHTLLYL